ncbi:MAG TPA: hypothetical protein VGI66_15390 [Streptosporangiaceae bacterium]
MTAERFASDRMITAMSKLQRSSSRVAEISLQAPCLITDAQAAMSPATVGCIGTAMTVARIVRRPFLTGGVAHPLHPLATSPAVLGGKYYTTQPTNHGGYGKWC